MKQKYIPLTLGVASLLSLGTAQAQQLLQGKVYDRESGEALPGASLLSQRGKSQVSDARGFYQLNAIEGDTIRVSFVGYEPISIAVSSLRRNPNIALTSGHRLQDLVVTASIASVRSAKAIGSKVDKVDVARLTRDASPSNLSELLDGRISGVQMFQSNGKVGMPIRFNMRSGATMSMDRDPIIYVDGIRYNNSHTSDINSSQDALSGLNDLAIEDIASIDVIKGPAAAASYGAEAANGVVVITTKRGRHKGKEDKDLRLEVKYSYGMSELARKYTQFVNNDALNNFFERAVQHKLYANVTKQFSQGSKLYLSANLNDVSGIVPGNRDQRSTLRAAYDLRQGPLALDVTTSYTRGDISLPQTAMGRYDAIWNMMINQKPWPYIEESSWRAQSWRYNNDRLLSTARLSYLLPYNIKAESMLGLDLNLIKGTYLLPYGYPVGTNAQGAKTVSNRRNSSLNWDIKLSKRTELNDDWQLTATLLSQLVRRHELTDKVVAARFGGDVTNIAAASERQVSESSFEQRTWGLYSELFLSYRDKLFVNAGLRRDASNLIGANVASILYPSLSLSYNIGGLKLRTAYGESGRLPYPTDAYTSYELKGTSAYGSLVKPQYLGNPDIRPERMRELELGADLKLGQRHTLGLTTYAQYTSDAIIYEEQLSSDGWVGSKPRNIGSVRGWGAELSYNGRLWDTQDGAYSLEAYATINYQGNEVTNTGGEDILNYPNVIREGLPVYAFYYRRVEAPAYNKDGSYNSKAGAVEGNDYHYLGKPFPDFNGSFGLDLRLAKRFTLSAKFSYALGASVYNQSFYNTAGLGDNLKKRNDALNKLSTLTVGTEEYKLVAEELARSARFRANYVEPADFLRFSSLSIGCDLSDLARQYSRNVLKGARLSISAQNLWLTTNYSGAEPQIESNGGTRQQRGIGSLSRDITNTPTPRTIVGTISLQF